MNSLRETIDTSPQLRRLMWEAADRDHRAEPTALGPARWDWQSVQRVLIVRLRSIGDTVLTTPSLFAARRFLPQAQIDILLEDWVAPVLKGCADVDNIITFQRGSKKERFRAARAIRKTGYDVVFNLHGGTTATLLTRASGAKHRVGFGHYQYKNLHNHLAPPSPELWGRAKLHSVEQQLALLGWTGIPVSDLPMSRLTVTPEAAKIVGQKLREVELDENRPFAVIHPAAAFATKQWAADRFARVAEELAGRGIASVAISAPNEAAIVAGLKQEARVPVAGLTDLSLPEVTALAAKARLFVGNDSGIAHMAAAAGAPSVVIFGSSNVTHWRPWTTRPNEIVREEFPCQPCHGYFCAEFEKPECILSVPVARVVGAIDRVLRGSS
ncbi:MAG: heptosyltransferase [Blastocatellia bacterium]|nr:heptosyltransferase [Blastocatellia bacterium]